MSSLRRTVATPLLALSMSVGLIAGVTAPTFADSKSDIRNKQKQVNKKLKQAKNDVKSSEARFEAASKELKASEKRLAGAVENLRSTRGQLVVAQIEDARLRRELDESERELGVAEKDVEKAEKHLDAAEREVARFTVDSVMQGDSGLRAFGDLLSGQDPSIFSARMSAKNSVADAQVARMQELAASRVLLEVERERLEDLRDAIARQKARAEENVAHMAVLEAQAEAQQRSVAKMVDENSKARKEADAALQEDKAIQAEFERERGELARRLQKIIDEELRKAGETGGDTFVDSVSTLSKPVAGRLTSKYGMRKHPILGYYRMHDGMDFGARCGTPIWAAASGTVVDRYYSRGYGNRIVVNHGVKRGASLMTTYNHLSRFNVTNGQKVTRGQVIGYVGTTGMSTGCHLHFMVLRNGQHTNPANWL